MVVHLLDRLNLPVGNVAGLELVNLSHDNLFGGFIRFKLALVSIEVWYCLHQNTTLVAACVKRYACELNITVDGKFVE